MLRRMTKSGIFAILLSISLLMPRASYGQFSEVEFIDFEMSDTVIIGGTLTIAGVLKNNGTIPIPAELALRMATGTEDNPPVPYGNHFFENNFNNGTIYPGEYQSFVRLIEVTQEWFDLANSNLEHNENTAAVKSAAAGGRIIAVIWPRGDGAELEHQENTSQQKSDFDNDMFLDSIVVLQPDEALVSESYHSNPAIIKGRDFEGTPLENLMPDEIVGFRYENEEWIQIPIQIDEMKWVDPYLLYNGAPVGDNTDGQLIKVYADAETYTGADDITTFDSDDELVFMLKDAGNFADLETAGLPSGIIEGTGVEISIQNTSLETDTYVYLFKQDGSMMQDADTSYVSYDFSLLSGDYLSTYNANYSNPENTAVVGDNYTLNFSDTWTVEDMNIVEGESSGVDILDGYDTFISEALDFNFDFSFRCFVTNKQGPVRAIRSYMRGDFGQPVDIQKTHLFYAKRHDVFTNLRSEYTSSSLFDILNVDVSQQHMNYQSNIDVTPLLADNGDDSLCVKLYSDVPLRWELIEGEQGSMGIVHEVLVDGIPDNNGLLNGYWNDGNVNSYTVVGAGGADGADGADGENGEPGEDGEDIVIATSTSTTGIGAWIPIANLGNQASDVEYRRYTYFDEPGMSVEAVNAHSASIRQRPFVDVTENNKHYEVKISAYLEGPFQHPTAGMDNSLNNVHDLLPGQDFWGDISVPEITPYSIAPWNYFNTECDISLSIEYPEKVVDWVLISFRTGLDSETEVAKTIGLLMKDGAIEFLNDCILTEEDGDSFYIVVEHRNHIGIVSPTPIPVVNYKLEYDFRTQNSYTNNGTRSGQKEIYPGIWAMFAGEGVQEANGNDINGNDKAQWVIENGNFLIYSPIDFNMDGTVDGQDKAIWFNNNGVSGALIR